LIELGANDIRALTKYPTKAQLPDGVTSVTGYLGEPDSLPAALDGVERMYLAPLPETLQPTLDLIKKAKVEYVVALSGAGDWQAHADTISASGLVNTQLGPGEFTDNFTIWSEQIKATRTVRDPYPSVVEAPISMDDIARVAAGLLVEPDESHHGKMYPITGPQSLTRAQIAEQIGAGIGVDVTFGQCNRAEAEAALRPTPWGNTRFGISIRSRPASTSRKRPISWSPNSPAPRPPQWRSGPLRTPSCSADSRVEVLRLGVVQHERIRGLLRMKL
jgi:uncharacterized protein YbjT (DUF2867 family)